MKEYDVLAELVDYRDGSRHYPPNPFTPEDEKHRDRLIAAGCLSKEPSKGKPASAAATTSTDGLDDLTVKQLQAKANERGVQLGKLSKKDEIIAALRAAAKPGNAPVDDGLDTSTDDHLLEVIEAEGIDVGEAKERDEIIAAIRAAREAKPK